MSASERLKALDARHVRVIPLFGRVGSTEWLRDRDAESVMDVLPQIVAVVEAAERKTAAISVIRALGFVGNSHYCSYCLNTFHDDCGQHEPDCKGLAALLLDAGWMEDRYDTTDAALTALEEALNG